MAEQTYTLDTLLEAWLSRARFLRRGWKDDPWVIYWSNEIKALESLLGITFSDAAWGNRKNWFMWDHFEWTVDSYVRIPTPLDGVIEYELPDDKRVEERLHEVLRAADALRERHVALLRSIVVATFGENDATFNSEDLRRTGFDDTQRPNEAPDIEKF